MDKETADSLRGMIRRVTLSNVKDDGETQTATAEVADGIVREEVEVMQPYGFASSPPEDGALAIAVALGGDQGDMVILPIGNPAKRMGKLNPKDVGLYNADGDKLILGAGGAAILKSGASILFQVGGASVTITDGQIVAKAGGVTATLSGGGLAIQGGQVTHDGQNIGSTHVHGGILKGSADTTGPH